SIFSTTVNAPGESFENKQFINYYDGYWSGTSMAAPMVSGAIALIQAINPGLGYREVKNILLDTTDNIFRLNPEYLSRLGSGRLNVYEAVKKAKDELASKELRLLFAPYSGKESKVSISDFKGNVINEFLAYGEVFKGGAYVSAGDVDGDGDEEIVSGAGYGGGPQIRIFDNTGKVEGQFFAYDKNFRGGVQVAVGDVDGDGREEIITGAGNGGGPQVRIFDYSGKVEGQFFAYDKNFRGGVRVSTARIIQGSGGKANILTAPGPGGGPHIKVFDNRARIKSQFFAYDKNFRGGVQIAAADIDYDGLDEIITGAGPGGTPHLRIFENGGTLLHSFFALEEEFEGGINVSAIKLKK
ncbi:FG-GAP repeat protein, partial [Candidatus Parcubacteria bacterium]|nr:FG-GAP repeat protein [Candidatus Parcubacteria bacterium]